MSRHCNPLLVIPILLLLGVVAFYPQAYGEDFATLAERALKCGVSPDSVEIVRSELLGGRATEEQANDLLQPLLEACVEQLPAEHLEGKLAEGLAKQVAPARIVPVLDRLLEAYRSARKILLTTAGKNDARAFSLLGDGLYKNVPVTDFEQYCARWGSLTDSEFLLGLEMVSLNGQAGFAPDLTDAVLNAGFPDHALTSGWRHFVRIILVARKQGRSDADIARAAVDVLKQGGSLAEVLPTLGLTGRDMGGQGVVE